ncbi:MAG: sigma-B regulation protein RsbU (phosphoserine phosphatase) [Verrucomicrobia bacterium]|nr:MAG: sigma-B regulation protein RsbU (phosphoserine phosphatase) [Verrucomicrobiota bacterium]
MHSVLASAGKRGKVTEISMHPLPAFVLGFATAAAVAWIFRRRGLRRIRGLEQEKEELLTEESRVFTFLHEIGGGLGSERAGRRLHEDIVHGLARVVGADGAALYLVDPRTGTMLVPAAVTKDCLPLVEVPEARRGQAVGALSSWLQLTAVPASGGLLGSCHVSQVPVNGGPLHGSGPWAMPVAEVQDGMTMMMAPVTSGGRRMGVVAVVQRAGKAAFSAHAFEVFRSAAEQSAFALASAMVQQEAMEKRRIEEELRSASEVQRILLPRSAPQLGDYEIEAANTPARVMSGDYYDYIRLDDDHMGLVIADVSGKGFPASLVMATCRALLRGVSAGELSPSAALGAVNRRLWGDVREDTFISMAYCVLDRNSPRIVMARAGHDAPLLYSSRTGEVTALKPPGLALGVDSGKVFDRVTRDFTFEMESGDCLLLYTDGVNEAVNGEGDEFGMDRLIETFRVSAGKGVKAVVEAFQRDVRAFAGAQPQSDDITIIAVRKR